MRAVPIWLAAVVLLTSGGCPFGATGERNPFLDFTETFGTSLLRDEQAPGGQAGGREAEIIFRRSMSVTFANFDPTADLNFAFAAWVLPSSIRDADQQDELLRGGYVQITRQVELGSAFILPPGTFVRNGSGVAGAQLFRLEQATNQATTLTIDLITPDVMLVFLTPPTSCDSVAFTFTVDGDPPQIRPPNAPGQGAPIQADESATGDLAVKTLGQIDVYQCNPFRPGLFLRQGGGLRQPNEYFEGDTVRFDFTRFTAADVAVQSFFGFVTISR